MLFERPAHNHNDCVRLFKAFFADPRNLLNEIVPGGWERSPLRATFHPPAQQQYEEAASANLVELLGQREGSPNKGPVLADFLDSTREQEIRPAEEVIRLVGLCLWDIFSDNHQVVDQDGKVYDLGSFRGSGGFIADYINSQFKELSFSLDYLDFYMGTLGAQRRVDLVPPYCWIFQNLRRLECDWIYSFPRLHLVRFDVAPDWSDPLKYDPGEALERDLEEQKIEGLQQHLDSAYWEAVEAASHKPLPATVQAYRDVFGVLPEGWPHRED